MDNLINHTLRTINMSLSFKIPRASVRARRWRALRTTAFKMMIRLLFFLPALAGAGTSDSGRGEMPDSHWSRSALDIDQSILDIDGNFIGWLWYPNSAMMNGRTGRPLAHILDFDNALIGRESSLAFIERRLWFFSVKPGKAARAGFGAAVGPHFKPALRSPTEEFESLSEKQTEYLIDSMGFDDHSVLRSRSNPTLAGSRFSWWNLPTKLYLFGSLALNSKTSLGLSLYPSCQSGSLQDSTFLYARSQGSAENSAYAKISTILHFDDMGNRLSLSVLRDLGSDTRLFGAFDWDWRRISRTDIRSHGLLTDSTGDPLDDLKKYDPWDHESQTIGVGSAYRPSFGVSLRRDSSRPWYMMFTPVIGKTMTVELFAEFYNGVQTQRSDKWNMGLRYSSVNSSRLPLPFSPYLEQVFMMTCGHWERESRDFWYMRGNPALELACRWTPIVRFGKHFFLSPLQIGLDLYIDQGMGLDFHEYGITTLGFDIPIRHGGIMVTSGYSTEDFLEKLNFRIWREFGGDWDRRSAPAD